MRRLTRRIFSLLDRKYIRGVLKILFFYSAIKLTVFLLSLIMDSQVMGLTRLEINASRDLSLNDLHYQIAPKNENKEVSKNIVLINSGSLTPEYFRSELADVLKQLEFYSPKVISVDHQFSVDTAKPGTSSLISEINVMSNIIIAKSSIKNDVVIPFSSDKYGTADFPKSYHTQRRYYTHDSTFARRTVHLFDSTAMLSEISTDSFVINYVANGFNKVDVAEGNVCLSSFLFSETAQGKFPYIDASQILMADDNTASCLSTLLKDKIVIIGHLGHTCLPDISFDLEDKLAVPFDTNLLYRQKTMPGMLIHANAIENMINQQSRFLVLSDSLWFKIFEELLILVYLYFLLFVRVGRILNILVLLVFTVPVLYVILQLMKLNIYVEMGTTLFQLLIFEEMAEFLEPVYRIFRSKVDEFKIYVNEE